MPYPNNRLMRRRIFGAWVSTVISISLVLLLVGVASILLLNARSVSDYFKENMQVSVLMKQDVSEEQALAYQSTLASVPGVRSTTFISREQGIEEMSKMLGSDFLDVFSSAPVPVSIDVNLEADYVSVDSLEVVKTLLSALLMDNKLNSVLFFIRRCNFILNRYLVFTLLDSLIVGVANALIMLLLRMPYVGMISVIAGITNLIPTFGPVIGAVISGFILLLVNPVYAIMFIAITLVLQICDGYIIKPKLFGNTLGVSGLLILIAIVTMGNAFGIGGILLAIPVAAICDYSYREGFLPYLQKRKEKKQETVKSEKESD